MNVPRKQPSTWDEYDGAHRGSMDSTTTSVHWNLDGEQTQRGESSGMTRRLRERRYSHQHSLSAAPHRLLIY